MRPGRKVGASRQGWGRPGVTPPLPPSPPRLGYRVRARHPVADGGSAKRAAGTSLISHRSIDARIIAWEVINLPMFIASAQLDYNYDFSDIYNPVVGSYFWDNTFWTTNSSSHWGSWDSKIPPVIAYRATAIGSFSSDRFPTPEFPDTFATTRSVAVGTDDGL